jgi:hypothetical protein
MSQRLEGGCLCGAVRYAVSGEPVTSGFCHCKLCRGSAGAPVMAWAMFPEGQFAYTKGKPAIYESTPGSLRAFCGACGTQVAFTGDGIPGLVDITVGSLDDPSALPPQAHIFESRRISWLHLSDDLPRFAEFPPQAPQP